MQLEAKIKFLKKVNNFSDIIKVNSKNLSNDIFIYDGNVNISYKTFDLLLDKCCHFFQESNISSKDVLSVVLENSLDFLIIYFASIRFGSIVNPIPLTSGVDGIKKNLDIIKPKLIFANEDFLKNFNNNKIFVIKNKNFFYKYLKKKYPDNTLKFNKKKILGKSIACYYFSSGTTGESKIIKYSNQSMVNGQLSLLKSNFSNIDRPTHLCFLPFGHTSVLRYSIKHCICLGGKIVIENSYWKIKKRFWKIVKDLRINYFQTVPTILKSIYLAYNKNIISKTKSLCFIGCGSAILDKSFHENFQRKFKIKVSNLYGLSETGATHFDNPSDRSRVPGSIGKPLEGVKCKILYKKKLLYKKNIKGIMFIKSNFLMSGYLNDRKNYLYNGFFKTGDIGRVDNNGIFHFEDRNKDMIIKGGVNILPSEIERAIIKINGVKEVAIKGQKHPFFGEDIICHVIINKKKTSLKKISSFCITKLGIFKSPSKFIIHNKFPKTASGKVIKRNL